MGDNHASQALFANDFLNGRLDFEFSRFVQRRGGFVEQQHQR